jgi:hypothetical protein
VARPYRRDEEERSVPMDAKSDEAFGLQGTHQTDVANAVPAIDPPIEDAASKQRDPLDRYYTPAKLAHRIAEIVATKVPGARSFLEPSSGGGVFIEGIRKAWDLPADEHYAQHLFGLKPRHDNGNLCWNIQAIDLDPDAAACAVQHGGTFWHGSFLNFGQRTEYDCILSNPPFALPPPPGKKRGSPIAAKHVEHMLKRLTPGGVCAVLIRQSFLGTVDRAQLFERYTPSLVHMLVERPSFTLDTATDQHEYAVIYWERESALRFAKRGSTRLEWLKWK